MPNFAIIRDGTVENIVVADVIGDISPPDGTTVVPVDTDAEIGGTYDGTNFAPIPPPPPEEPTAPGAQMVDEAESRGKLDMLTAALTPSEMAVFLTRRRIVAGSPFAEVLRSKLGVSASAMASFIAAAAVRKEI